MDPEDKDFYVYINKFHFHLTCSWEKCDKTCLKVKCSKTIYVADCMGAFSPQNVRVSPAILRRILSLFFDKRVICHFAYDMSFYRNKLFIVAMKFYLSSQNLGNTT